MLIEDVRFRLTLTLKFLKFIQCQTQYKLRPEMATISSSLSFMQQQHVIVRHINTMVMTLFGKWKFFIPPHFQYTCYSNINLMIFLLINSWKTINRKGKKEEKWVFLWKGKGQGIRDLECIFECSIYLPSRWMVYLATSLSFCFIIILSDIKNSLSETRSPFLFISHENSKTKKLFNLHKAI